STIFPPAIYLPFIFFFSSRRRHTRFDCDWSSDVCSSDLSTAPRRWANSFDTPCSSIMLMTSGDGRGKAFGIVPYGRKIRLGGDRSEERRVGKEWRGWWWGEP